MEDVTAQAGHYRKFVAMSGRGHYVAAERAEARGRALGIASAAISTVVGTSIFASLGESPSVGWKVGAGLGSTLAAVLVALVTFLDYGKGASLHRVTGAAYGKLRREFDLYFLAVQGADRDEALRSLSELTRKMDELGEAAPLIPPSSYKKAKLQVEKRSRVV
jgi:hypothetical protein